MTDLIPMEDLLRPATPDPSAAPWPNSPPIHGNVYGFHCPSTGAEMVAMTKDTFLQHGTHMEGMRRANHDLDGRVKELVAQLADLQTRHENLREATRKDRLAQLEKQIQLPGSGLKKLFKR
jgi:hypothetical protein